MRNLIFLAFLVITFPGYGQTKCDTIISKTDYLKMLYVLNQCNTDAEAYSEKIKILENTLQYYSQRIRFLENIILDREKYTIKKCPKFKKKKKANRYYKFS